VQNTILNCSLNVAGNSHHTLIILGMYLFTFTNGRGAIWSASEIAPLPISGFQRTLSVSIASDGDKEATIPIVNYTKAIMQ